MSFGDENKDIYIYISTGIIDDKLRPQIVSVVPTANAPLSPYNITSMML